VPDSCSRGGGGTDIEWLVPDQLGTPRMIFDKTGSLPGMKRHDYLPFGEELYAAVGIRSTTLGYTISDGVRQKFSQKERDSETNLDYFLARYYSSMQGRFTSPDSYSGRLVSPQTLNLYSYVRNNPLKYIDPDGHQGQDPKKTTDPDICDDCVVHVKVVDAEQKKKQQQNQEPSGIDWNAFNMWVWQQNNRMRNIALKTTFGYMKWSFAPISSSIRTFGGHQALHDYEDATMALLPLAMETQAEIEMERTEAGLEGELDALMEGTLFRNGAFTEMNFTPGAVDANTGLSTFDTLEAATAPGGKAQVIDVSLLTNLRAVPNGPPGHFGIFPRDPSRMHEWISTRGTPAVHEFTQELMNARTHEVRRAN
jgi:RHS repeat-associated protein